MSALSFRTVLSLIAHLYFQLRWLTQRPVSKVTSCSVRLNRQRCLQSQLKRLTREHEGSPVAAHIFTSQAGPMGQLTVSGIMMLGFSRALWRHTYFILLPLPRCFNVRLISHARAHCRLPRGPVCGDMGGMPGWSCHCNATATHIAPVRTQHAPVTGSTHRNTQHTPGSRGVGTPGVIWHH